MSLGYRLKRFIKSDIHGFVEGLEEPRWVLAQAIRDMEEELERMEAAVAAKKSHIFKLHESLKANTSIVKSLEDDIEFALQEKREDIAKPLIRRQLIALKTVEAVTTEESQCARDLEELTTELQARQKSFQDIRARSERLKLVTNDENPFSEAENLMSGDETLDQQVELEFLRRLQRSREVNNGS